MKSIPFSFSVLFFSILTLSLSWAQPKAPEDPNKAKIAGRVTDQASGEPMVGATVLLEGTTQGALTDVDGRFHLHVNAGAYTLTISYMSYKTTKIAVEVTASELKTVDVAMEEVGATTDAVEITYTIQQSSSLAMMMERKNAATVSDGVSAELIRRTPDRTTADVLKRVTGASIQEGKFAIIRGMNDRYNAGYLDGALMPSTESDRKAFAFDAVPANLIDNLQIIKAGSPDMAGDFGGGIIRINTKAVPETFTQTLSVGGHYNSITTRKTFQQVASYPGEVFGLYNSDRSIANVPVLTTKTAIVSAAEIPALVEGSAAFNHNWDKTVEPAPLNTRLSYSLGMPIKIGKDRKLGVIFALNYANTRKTTQGSIASYEDAGPSVALADTSYTQNINAGGLFNVSYVGKKTEVNFRNLLNANSDNTTTKRGGISNFTEDLRVRGVSNYYTYNRLYNSILSSKHIVGDRLFTVNASVSLSNIRRSVPDYRIVNYTKTTDSDYSLPPGDFFNSSSGRFTSSLNERVLSGTLDLSKELNTESLKTTLKVGGLYQNRSRVFTSRSFVYSNRFGGVYEGLAYDPAIDLAADKFSVNGLFMLEKTSPDMANYEGAQTLGAIYASADQRFAEKLRAVYGVRYENADIHITNEVAKLDIARIEQGVWLPSANLTWSLTKKMNLRGAYYASVNRPEFRELAPFAFYAFDKNAEIKGNPNLQVARLNNVDLRWELFPSGSQIVSVGAFYKSILNPIEFSLDIAQSTTTFTFENEKKAEIYGVELEFRKNFAFLGNAQLLQDLTAYANLSLIKSKLQFEEGSKAQVGRPLQGQSPYIINGGLQYESEQYGWSASVTVNRTGRRIAYVGVAPENGDTRQDIWENPRTVLDAQIGKTIGHFNLKFTLGDLFHQDLVFYQDADQDKKFTTVEGTKDRVMFKYTNGFTMNLGASVTF